uniref:C-type lectin domain-containing protein n=1 Tax=Pelusios castaneus TaxID=367368 RepID=A0A8C8S7M2_9SAUR
IVLGAVSLTLFITVIVLAGEFSALPAPLSRLPSLLTVGQRIPGDCPSADLGPPAGPACPNGWVGFRGKCYYFSEDEGNWTSSQTHCSAFNTSLAGIDTRQDMDFMVRYKGTFDYWIGLRRDLGQPWKWANGTEFNNLFLIGGGGDDCAYLNQGEVSSSQCTDTRFWICSKPDVFTEARQIAVEEAGSLSGLEKL